MTLGQTKTYRHHIDHKTLNSFQVNVQETDLLIHASQDEKQYATDRVIAHRAVIEKFIQRYPEFLTTLVPWQVQQPVPKIIQAMIGAAKKANVGPMAAVAGTIAQFVGQDLLTRSDEVVIENGGDIFIKRNQPMVIGIYAGKSPLSLKIGIKLDSGGNSLGVCTSSGTVGHSLSLGKADAVCVISASCALADAAATSIGNHVRSALDIADAIEYGKVIEGVDGILIIAGKKIGLWGDVEITPLS